jgi:hypothetical protein
MAPIPASKAWRAGAMFRRSDRDSAASISRGLIGLLATPYHGTREAYEAAPDQPQPQAPSQTTRDHEASDLAAAMIDREATEVVLDGCQLAEVVLNLAETTH